MAEVLLITLPVFLIVAAGWLAARIKLAKPEWVHVLNIFVYYIGLPALILHGFGAWIYIKHNLVRLWP